MRARGGAVHPPNPAVEGESDGPGVRDGVAGIGVGEGVVRDGRDGGRVEEGAVGSDGHAAAVRGGEGACGEDRSAGVGVDGVDAPRREVDGGCCGRRGRPSGDVGLGVADEAGIGLGIGLGLDGQVVGGARLGAAVRSHGGISDGDGDREGTGLGRHSGEDAGRGERQARRKC